MSETILRYVPLDPNWQPSDEQSGQAVSLLKAMAPLAENVSGHFEDDVRFYDPGENWSGVKCPNCKADVEGWWGEAMDTAFASEFKNLSAEAPCCSTTVNLNGLDYVWPAGFGRFALEALNPTMDDTTHEQDQQLAERLGAPLRKIWARY
ncbi:hypothetical protein HGO37_01160 [Rhizobium sp. CG4]|uniref:hypothetical protein n=1 Tax=Rhizobium sp. CG4 TaxID=2726075 RepID=UPI00203373FA|nr:hypothetical protein [Rhizobium sp. CG4]MCM2453984.1 hypothetical protein [Rhizobium sp. CG4]